MYIPPVQGPVCCAEWLVYPHPPGGRGSVLLCLQVILVNDAVEGGWEQPKETKFPRQPRNAQGRTNEITSPTPNAVKITEVHGVEVFKVPDDQCL